MQFDGSALALEREITVDSRPVSANVSANDSPIYTLFDVETTTELTRDHILRLAAGVLGAVVVKGFSSRDDCRHVMDALEDRPLGAYDEQLIWPRISKLGPAAYDFYAGRALDERYWQQASEAIAVRSTLLRGRDPMDHAIGELGRAWADEIVAATSVGLPLFAGMFREINEGTKLHFDEITREFPGILDEVPASFLSLNWYVGMPASGGGTSVYRHRWRPADEVHRDLYGYGEAAVEGEPVASFQPEVGDAAIFDTRNLHAVEPATGPGRRVALSFFLGVTGRGPLEIWS